MTQHILEYSFGLRAGVKYDIYFLWTSVVESKVAVMSKKNSLKLCYFEV